MNPSPYRHSFDPTAIFEELFERWGAQHWWPAETDFEVVVGTILTQNTNWANVERAIDNLKDRGLLNPASMESIDTVDLAEAIRPSGYFNIKARRLKNFIDHLSQRHGGNLDRMFELETGALRSELLLIDGVGPETADSILLYAAQRAVFVVDAYTRRFMIRHGWAAKGDDYAAVAGKYARNLPEDVQLFNEYHALIVRLGKEHCRPRPVCERCPLKIYLN